MIMTCQAFIMTKNVKVSGFVVNPIRATAL